ncbi:MAG: hypothetical protein KJ792_12155, partial [Actinobacteria bacterium]|nr:hypothetical protein [Actinomycetota bacterium]
MSRLSRTAFAVVTVVPPEAVSCTPAGTPVLELPGLGVVGAGTAGAVVVDVGFGVAVDFGAVDVVDEVVGVGVGVTVGVGSAVALAVGVGAHVGVAVGVEVADQDGIEVGLPEAPGQNTTSTQYCRWCSPRLGNRTPVPPTETAAVSSSTWSSGETDCPWKSEVVEYRPSG